jgi:hypothetical protein
MSAHSRRISDSANPIDLFSRAKLGVQEVVGVQHSRFTVTGDILWTLVEVQSSNSLLNPAPDGAITMVVRCTPQPCPLARQVMP